MSQSFPVNEDPRFRVSTATAGQSVFGVPFPFLRPDDISVERLSINGVRTVLQRAVHYTLVGAGSPTGGTVTLKPAFLAKAGEIYTLIGQAILTRDGSVTQAGRYNSEIIDRDFDRLTIIAQEHHRDLARALKSDYGATPPGVTIGASGTIPVWLDGNLVEGPTAAALEAVDVALGVAAGRALVHGEAGGSPYAAGGRRIAGIAEGIADDDAVTKGQLNDVVGDIDPAGLLARVEALEGQMAAAFVPGDIKMTARKYEVDPTGWLLLTTTRTIGGPGSGATALAGAGAAACFNAVWTDYNNEACPIYDSAGVPAVRGANAAADFAAGRRLTLPTPAGRFPRIASAAKTPGLKEASQNKDHGHTASFAGQPMSPHRHEMDATDDNNSNPGNNVSRNNTNISPATLDTSAVSAGTPAGTVTVNNSGGDEARPDSFVFTGLIKL